MGTPEANKKPWHHRMARSNEKGEGSWGWWWGEYPPVSLSASRGPSSGMDKRRIMRSRWMGSRNPTGEKNKSPVGEEGGGLVVLGVGKTRERWRGRRKEKRDPRNKEMGNKASRVHVEQGKRTQRQSGSCPSGPAGRSRRKALRLHPLEISTGPWNLKTDSSKVANGESPIEGSWNVTWVTCTPSWLRHLGAVSRNRGWGESSGENCHG